MATQTAGWLAKETSKISLHAVPVGSSGALQGVGKNVVAVGADSAKRDEFSQTAVAVNEWQPDSRYALAGVAAPTSAVALPVQSRRAMKRMERELRRQSGPAAPQAHATSAATAATPAAVFQSDVVKADGPVVVVEAAVVVGPQQWQQHLAEQHSQQKQMPQQPSMFQQQQQHTPEQDQAAGSLARFFKTAGQQRVLGQDPPSAASLRPSLPAVVTSSSAPDQRVATAAPAYTRLQPAALPVPHETQDVWGALGGVWGGLGDLAGSSLGSGGSGSGGTMFVGDKQVDTRPAAQDALWTGFGSGAGI